MAYAGIALRQRVAPTGAIMFGTVFDLGNWAGPILSSGQMETVIKEPPRCLKTYPNASQVSLTG